MPHIRDKLAARGINVPLIGDFHYIGHKLLTVHPAAAEALIDPQDKPRVTGSEPLRLTYAEANRAVANLAAHFAQVPLPAGS